MSPLTRVWPILIAAGALPLAAGSIEGRVTNSVTGEPVIGATVRFIDSHSYVYSGSTDSSGAYRVDGLEEG